MNNFSLLIRRIKRHWPLWCVLLVGSLLATTLIALGPTLSDAILQIGLQSRLASEPDTNGNIRFSDRLSPVTDDYATVDALARQQIDAQVSHIRGEVIPAGETSALIPMRSGSPVETERITFRFYGDDNFNQHAQFVAGGWPMAEAGAGEPFPVVLSVNSAAHFEAEIGTIIALTSQRASPELIAEAVVVGIIEANDSSHPYWFGRYSPLASSPNSQGNSVFSFLVPQAQFTALAATVLPSSDIYVSWYVLTDPTLRVEQAPAISSRIRTWRDSPLATTTANIDTALDVTLLAYAEQAAIVRPPLFLLLGIVVTLAACFVLFTGTLILINMRPEFAVLFSRGASLRQLFQLQLTEALAIVGVAILCAPTLAWLLVRLLMLVGPLAAIEGAQLPFALSTNSWLGALGGGGLTLAALLLPVPLSLRQSIVILEQGRPQAPTEAIWRRYYLDVFGLVVGLILLWRLQLLGSIVGSVAEGTAGTTDWLLILTPILLLVALSIIFARLFPPIMSAAAQLAGHRRALAPVMALWHAARNPTHVTRLVLMIAFATALGLLATSLEATLSINEQDRASFTVGGDYRLTSADPILQDVEGSRIWRGRGAIDIDDGRGDQFELLAFDPDEIATLINFREDFSTQTLPELMEALQSDIPESYLAPPFIELQGEPAELTAQLRFHTIDMLDLLPRFAFNAKLLAADGQIYYVQLDPPETLPEEPDWVTFSGTVPQLPENAYPLQLLSFWFRMGHSVWILPEYSPVVEDLVAIDKEGNEQLVASFELSEEARWYSLNPTFFLQPNYEWTQSGRTSLSMGWGFQQTVVGLWYGLNQWQPSRLQTLPAIVTPAFLEASGLEEGNSAPIRIDTQDATGWRSLSIEIVGVVDSFPTLADEKPAGSVILSQTPLLTRLNADSFANLQPNELWLPNAPNDSHAALVANATSSSNVTTILQQLRAIPIALGLRSVTQLGYWLAMIFCLASVGSYVFITLRQNESLYAILRAIGMSEAQLFTTLLLEQAALLILGLLLGSGVGFFLIQLFLSSLPLQLGDALAKPPFIVVVDWTRLSTVYLVLLVGLLSTVAVTTFILRRRQMQTALRQLEVIG